MNILQTSITYLQISQFPIIYYITKFNAFDAKTRTKVLLGIMLETYLKTCITMLTCECTSRGNGSFHTWKYRMKTGVLHLDTFGYHNEYRLTGIRAFIWKTLNYPHKDCFLWVLHPLEAWFKCLTNITCYKMETSSKTISSVFAEIQMFNWQEMPTEHAQSRTIWTNMFIDVYRIRT